MSKDSRVAFIYMVCTRDKDGTEGFITCSVKDEGGDDSPRPLIFSERASLDRAMAILGRDLRRDAKKQGKEIITAEFARVG